MLEDFPAAHSMDTEWFAVDQQGQVARFRSGEAGAVPSDYRSLVGGQDSLDTILEELVRFAEEIPGFQFYVEDLTTEADGSIFRRRHWGTPWDQPYTDEDRVPLADIKTYAWMCLVWLREDADLSQIKGKYWRLPTVGPVFLWFQQWDAKEFKRWHKQGAICRAWLEEFSPERFGFYTYEHSDACENWISGPYVKTAEPRFPLFVLQLPGKFRAILETVRFQGVHFGESDRIQPVEHFPCNSWQADWQDLAGERHEFAPPDPQAPPPSVHE